MTALLIYSLMLYAAVLMSGLAQRSAASTSVLCLLVGVIAGRGGFGWLDWTVREPLVRNLAVLALVSVLFADGMRLGVRELRAAWRLPGRALLLGLPLTLLLIAAFAHVLAGIGWLVAFLLAAILTPTDPVFAAAIVDRSDLSKPLRRLLNVESGLNDGLALPAVLVLVDALGRESRGAAALIVEAVGGAVLGLVLPWMARQIRLRAPRIASGRRPLYALAVWLLTMATAVQLGANEYLASFFAGVSLATFDADLRNAFHRAAEQLGELLKLAALLVFGTLITPQFVGSLSWSDWAFAAATLVLARPMAILPSLYASALPWRERLVAAWFGPKGFASVIYAIHVLRSDVPQADRLYHLAAVVVLLSILVHSSTDVPAARWLLRAQRAEHSGERKR